MQANRTHVRENKAPAWGKKPQASGAGSGASPAHKIEEILDNVYGQLLDALNIAVDLESADERDIYAILYLSGECMNKLREIQTIVEKALQGVRRE